MLFGIFSRRAPIAAAPALHSLAQRSGALREFVPANAQFDVVIGGAGPGGLAAAHRLTEQGARVLVLEAQAESAPTVQNVGIMLAPTMRLLDDLKILNKVAPAVSDRFPFRPEAKAVAAIGSVTNALRDAAQGRFEIRYATPVSTVAQEAQGVSVSVQGTNDTIRAALYIDATGGKTQALADAGIIQKAHGQPVILRAAHFDPIHFSDSELAKGRWGHLPNLQVRDEKFGSVGIFGFSNSIDGFTMFSYRPTTQMADATDMRKLARKGNIYTSPHWERTIVVQPTMAEIVRDRRVFAIGDSIAHKTPANAPGMNQAVRDGQTVATAWKAMADGTSPEKALKELEEELFFGHDRHFQGGPAAF